MNTNNKPRGRPKKDKGKPPSEEELRELAPEFFYYTDLNDMEKKSISLEGLRRVAKDYLAWGRREKKTEDDPEEALVPGEFYLKMGWAPTFWKNCLERSIYLRNADEQVRRLCAVRRQHGSMKKRYDFKASSFDMYTLSPEWDEAERRQQTMRIQQLEKQVESLTKYIDMSKPPVQSDEEYRKAVEGTKE